MLIEKFKTWIHENRKKTIAIGSTMGAAIVLIAGTITFTALNGKGGLEVISSSGTDLVSETVSVSSTEISEIPESTETITKPNGETQTTSNPSSGSTSSSKPSGGSSSSSKPSGGSSSSSKPSGGGSSSSKPSGGNTSSSKPPVESKPEEPELPVNATIPEDARKYDPLGNKIKSSYTEAEIQASINAAIKYLTSQGMKYWPEMNKDNSSWEHPVETNAKVYTPYGQVVDRLLRYKAEGTLDFGLYYEPTTWHGKPIWWIYVFWG